MTTSTPPSPPSPAASPIPKTTLPYIQTPLIESLYLSQLAGCKVLLKYETTQPSGSFKSRGLGHLVYKHVQTHFGNAEDAPTDTNTTKLHFFSSSGGNAGCATAYAAKKYNQLCTVCVPLSTPPGMIQRIEKTGARVIPYGQYIADADKYLKEILIPACDLSLEKPVYCHPYNDPLVWTGNATVADEIVVQTETLFPDYNPAAVVCSVGGGGLFNGICTGFENSGKKQWQKIPLVAVETEGCSTLFDSLATGSQVCLDRPHTIASSLATHNVTRETIEWAKKHPTTAVKVTDREAAASCLEFVADHKVLVEAACGTALAPIYNGTLKDIVPGLGPEDAVIVIVCGGTNVTFAQLREYADKFELDF
jgi:L-serine/L-threonine ammonia-lyase